MEREFTPRRINRSQSFSSPAKTTVESGRARANSFSAKNATQRKVDELLKSKPLALMAFGQDEKEQYLARHGNASHAVLNKRAQIVANKVLNWVSDIGLAEEIMALNPTLREVEEMMKLNVSRDSLINTLKNKFRPIEPTVVHIAMAYTQEDLDDYLANYTDQTAARDVLDWLFDFEKAKQIMTLNPDVDEVKKLKSLVGPSNVFESVEALLGLVAVGSVTNVTKLLMLAHSSIKKTVEANRAYYKIDAEWEKLKKQFPKNNAGMTAVLDNTELFWDNVGATLRHQLKRVEEIDKDELLEFLENKAQMEKRMPAIRLLISAFSDSQKNLEMAQQKKEEISKIQGRDIDPLKKYHRSALADSLANTAIGGQQTVVDTHIRKVNDEIRDILGEINSFQNLDPSDIVLAQQEVQRQITHSQTLTAIDLTTVQQALNVYLTNTLYQEAGKYANLNLSLWAANHSCWTNLNDSQKQRLNRKLAGVSVTGWTDAGFPATRTRFTIPGRILIPIIAGTPLHIGGELVYDWIFENKDGHGRHPAKKIIEETRKAQAGEDLRIGSFVCEFDSKNSNNEVFRWKNITTRIVIKGGTIVTYFNESV